MKMTAGFSFADMSTTAVWRFRGIVRATGKPGEHREAQRKGASKRFASSSVTAEEQRDNF